MVAGDRNACTKKGNMPNKAIAGLTKQEQILRLAAAVACGSNSFLKGFQRLCATLTLPFFFLSPCSSFHVSTLYQSHSSETTTNLTHQKFHLRPHLTHILGRSLEFLPPRRNRNGPTSGFQA